MRFSDQSVDIAVPSQFGWHDVRLSPSRPHKKGARSIVTGWYGNRFYQASIRFSKRQYRLVMAGSSCAQDICRRVIENGINQLMRLPQR